MPTVRLNIANRYYNSAGFLSQYWKMCETGVYSQTLKFVGCRPAIPMRDTTQRSVAAHPPGPRVWTVHTDLPIRRRNREI